MPVQFILNGERAHFDGDPTMPLLWYLRDHAGLTGAKYGCGIGVCGACTVHLAGRAQRSCVTTMAAVAGQEVVTIEGGDDRVFAAVRSAWASVPQCGWCQTGQIMAAVDLMRRSKLKPSDADIDSLTNLCRCGTHPAIREAIGRAARALAGEEA
jgi:isoquinoline 1-oxidoreductase alpha subunit